jgi:multidrug efflux pump subunit AcrA (membrane-fusion protein)
MKSKIPILVLIISFYSCQNKKEVIKPEIRNITESVYASGLLKSENQHDVFTKINGTILEIAVKEGESIVKDQVLFRIDNPTAKLQVDNAKLQAEASDYYENIQKLKDALNKIELAQKKLSNDSLLFIRQKKLFNNNIGTKVDYEQIELAYEKSKVSLNEAKVYYDNLKKEIDLLSKQTKNNLKIVESQEKDLIIKSDLDGVIYKVNVKEGEMASLMSPLAIIGGNDFIIELNIDEFDISKIKLGQKIIIRMDSYKADVYEATVSYIYPLMNSRTRSFTIEGKFTKKPKVLYPNLTLEANIITEEKNNVLTIPTSYLVKDSFVILENGTLQNVKIGLKDYNLTEIISGIDANSKLKKLEE